jgi:hypothetical protein
MTPAPAFAILEGANQPGSELPLSRERGQESRLDRVKLTMPREGWDRFVVT